MRETCREMTNKERTERKVPPGCEAYLVTIGAQEVILLRQYDVQMNDFACRAFSRFQWARALDVVTQGREVA